ncbi:MAG: hypothetical protein ACRD1K_20505 [Acidimicrobiales bacterium]
MSFYAHNPYEDLMSNAEEDARQAIVDKLAQAAELVDRAGTLLHEVGWLHLELKEQRDASLKFDASHELERFHKVWMEENFGVKVEVIRS